MVALLRPHHHLNGTMGRWDGGTLSMLRLAKIARIRAENRPKSRGKIWRERKNVVPLPLH